MSNILTHNRNILEVKLHKGDYWDFHLSIPTTASNMNTGNNCVIADIDFNNDNCILFDTVCSNVIWDNAVNKGVTLDNIGYTGVDNGLLSYELHKISNRDFMHIFTQSSFYIPLDNNRLILNKVTGNHGIYDYSSDILDVDDRQVARLNGGFYQGFFKTDSCEYQVLPDKLEGSWTIAVDLKPMDFVNNNLTLNDVYPENKGMFLYIGTRAENKWWTSFKTKHGFVECNNWYGDDAYSTDYFEKVDNLNDYVEPCNSTMYSTDGFFGNDYLTDKGIERTTCGAYVTDEYLEQDIDIDANMKLVTKEGYDVAQPNMIEIKTDNKFLLFNHTKDGFTTDTWKGDEDVILYNVKPKHHQNFFTLFHHADGGYTTKTIKPLLDEWSKEYDVLKDLYNNALGFQVKDDGSIGYKYLVRDCENDYYKIESEYSKPDMVKKGEWNKIEVKLISENNNKMRLMFYVNKRLKLVSKLLPILDLRKLDDLYCKQEGVPYNISLGGGTQGLCEVVYLNYRQEPTDKLPIEENFAGTFVGYIGAFKFQNC